VGISFGADRIYDVMLGLGLFPEEANITTRALFLNFGGEYELQALKLLQQVRAHCVSSEIYPEAAKIKKQMDYANRRGIPFVVIVGENELAQGAATVKNMRTGEQHSVTFANLTDAL
jgi:histidyl-tRNA synthetase